MRLPTLEPGLGVPGNPADIGALLAAASGSELDRYLEYHYGRNLGQLLEPIGDNQVGESVRHNGVYSQIKEARRADDPTLPLGVWSHDLKTAEWDVVEKTALDALCSKSKDLQLGVWLMESGIHKKGFAGVAPGAVLIRTLCQAYWDNMHPQMQDGDIEFRTNPINWINEKLSLQLRLIPITAAPMDGREMCWDDWDKAQRFEQLQRKNPGRIEWDGPTAEGFKQRLAATPNEHILQLCDDIEDGKAAVADLVAWFDGVCGEDSPSLAEITRLLELVQTMLRGELKRRGVDMAGRKGTAGSAGDGSAAAADAGGGGAAQGDGGDGGAGGDAALLRNRSDAFALLRRAAEFLLHDDPHSPVPYMVYTACSWGEKSAPDLYKELFLVKGGQLNIFEVMGLETGK